MASHMLK